MSEKAKPIQYDLEEARDLVARRNDELNPSEARRREATVALLQHLLSLGGVTGVKMELDPTGPGGLWIYAGSTAVKLLPDNRKGTIFVSAGAGPNKPIPGLVFDPVTNRWEGEKVDEYRSFPLGARPEKRSAVAVVLEHAFNLARAQ